MPSGAAEAMLHSLVRHFLGSLIGRGVLEDDGVEAVRGLVFGAVGGLISVGFLLPRQFSRIYLELSYLPDPEPFRQALAADSLFMLSLPFLVSLVAAALVAPSMFPDEVDYLTLVPLPIARRWIFVAKVIALVLFVGALLLSLALCAAVAFPMFTHHRWAEGGIFARMAAHAAAATASGLFGFACVVALQGLGSVLAPRRWLPRLAVVVPGVIITTAVLTMPFVLQLPAQRAWVASEPAVLFFFPPAWFAGLERTLLGIAAPFWTRMTWTGAGATAGIISVCVAAYVLLFRHFERLVLPHAPARTVRPASRALPHMTVWRFATATLSRNRLPLLLFLVFAATGAGVVITALLNGFLSPTFRWDEPPPAALLRAVLALPLVLVLAGLTGLRMAFLLPVQSGANWIFRLTDSPESRTRHLASVDAACLRLVVLPAFCIAAPLQVWVMGPDAWRPLLLTVLASFTMTEVALLDWRRVPFTCTWIPGKRPLVFTLIGAMTVFFLVTQVLATLVHVSLFSWPVTMTLAGLLLATAATARHRRQRSWLTQPLQFEDDPVRLQTLGLS